MIGLNKELRFFGKCQNNAVIASQSADWYGNPYPYLRGNSPSGNPFSFMQSILDTDCRVARLPRNDSARRG